MRTPLVNILSRPEVRGNFWPLAGVIPWHCWAPLERGGNERVSDGFFPSRLRDIGKMPIFARHWNILSPLGLPTPPSVERFPAYLKIASARALGGAVQARVVQSGREEINALAEARKRTRALAAAAAAATTAGTADTKAVGRPAKKRSWPSRCCCSYQPSKETSPTTAPSV